MILEKKKAVLDMVHDANTVYLENKNKIIEFTGDVEASIDFVCFNYIRLTYDSNIKLQEEIDKILNMKDKSIDGYYIEKVGVMVFGEDGEEDEDEGVYEYIRLERKIYYNTKILEIDGVEINNRDNKLTFNISDTDVEIEEITFSDEELKLLESLNE